MADLSRDIIVLFKIALKLPKQVVNVFVCNSATYKHFFGFEGLGRLRMAVGTQPDPLAEGDVRILLFLIGFSRPTYL